MTMNFCRTGDDSDCLSSDRNEATMSDADGRIGGAHVRAMVDYAGSKLRKGKAVEYQI